MSNHVKISLLGFSNPRPPKSYTSGDFKTYADTIMKLFKKNIDNVLPDSPDLIVFPECSNRFAIAEGQLFEDAIQERIEFYRYAKDYFIDYMREVARNNNVNIAYSAVRPSYTDENKFFNSITYIDRNGETAGVYDKCYPVMKEHKNGLVQYGKSPELIQLDFGKVASAICFDLNFDDLLNTYKAQDPDLIVFSSAYHGGIRQSHWAYSCRSYFAGCVSEGGPSAILNPFGEIVAKETNYHAFTTADINLDYELCHLDLNWTKIIQAKKKYKSALQVYDPGHVGVVMLSCEDKDMTIKDIIKEFDIMLLDDYFNATIEHRKTFIQP